MDGAIMPSIAWAGNIIFIGLGIFAIKAYVKDIKSDTMKECDDLWKAVNTHGHKGLDKNGSRVTRGG